MTGIHIFQLQLKFSGDVQLLAWRVLYNFWCIDQRVPKIEILALFLAKNKVSGYLLKIKGKQWIFLIQQFLFIMSKNSFLSKLWIAGVLVNLALIVRFVFSFHLDKKLLSMWTDLGAGSSLDKIFYLFPIFSVEFEAVEKLLMFLSGPSACGSRFDVNECGHLDIFFLVEFEIIINKFKRFLYTTIRLNNFKYLRKHFENILISLFS